MLFSLLKMLTDTSMYSTCVLWNHRDTKELYRLLRHEQFGLFYRNSQQWFEPKQHFETTRLCIGRCCVFMKPGKRLTQMWIFGRKKKRNLVLETLMFLFEVSKVKTMNDCLCLKSSHTKLCSTSTLRRKTNKKLLY